MTKLCLLAGNYDEAEKWASGQNLESNSWFYPKNESDLLFKSNFYVLVIGTAGMNVPSNFFERIYSLAVTRGKIGRI